MSHFCVEYILYAQRRRAELVLSTSQKRIFTYSIVGSCLRLRIAEIGTSMFRPAISSRLNSALPNSETHQEERLHLVLMPDRHLIDVDDRRISAARNPTVLLNCLEYSPAVFTVAVIARQAERDKQRFNGFRSTRLISQTGKCGKEESRRAGACIVRHTEGILRCCTHDKLATCFTDEQASAPCAFDVPITGSIPYVSHVITRDSEMCYFRGESPGR